MKLTMKLDKPYDLLIDFPMCQDIFFDITQKHIYKTFPDITVESLSYATSHRLIETRKVSRPSGILMGLSIISHRPYPRPRSHLISNSSAGMLLSFVISEKPVAMMQVVEEAWHKSSWKECPQPKLPKEGCVLFPEPQGEYAPPNDYFRVFTRGDLEKKVTEFLGYVDVFLLL